MMPPRTAIERVADEEFVDGYPNLRDWSILLAYRGSVSHGTYVPPNLPNSTDDVDLMGIAVPPLNFYAGLAEFGSRGTSEIVEDPYDVVLYESRKAVRLLSKGNPNIINMLWLRPEMYLRKTKAGEYLCSQRGVFATKALYKPFRGYARSQMEKMTHGAYNGRMGDKRKAIVDKYGYDTKNASHLIRLLRQGTEFMRTGEMVVDRREGCDDAQELIDIKNGVWPLEEVKREAFWLEDELRHAYEYSKLPEAPNQLALEGIALTLFNIHREEKT